MLFCHEQAFVEQSVVYDELNRALQGRLQLIEVSREAVSLDAAVNSYLFNSQLLSLSNGQTLLVPQECTEQPDVWQYLQSLSGTSGGINRLEVVDLRQSMHNGGGPACLRLRVVLTEAERHALHQGVRLTEHLYEQLVDWVQRHYRDRLLVDDLADPALMLEVRCALDELSQILALQGIYPFQQN